MNKIQADASQPLLLQLFMVAIWKMRAHLPSLRIELTMDDCASMDLAALGRTPRLQLKRNERSIEVQLFFDDALPLAAKAQEARDEMEADA